MTEFFFFDETATLHGCHEEQFNFFSFSTDELVTDYTKFNNFMKLSISKYVQLVLEELRLTYEDMRYAFFRNLGLFFCVLIPFFLIAIQFKSQSNSMTAVTSLIPLIGGQILAYINSMKPDRYGQLKRQFDKMSDQDK